MTFSAATACPPDAVPPATVGIAFFLLFFLHGPLIFFSAVLSRLFLEGEKPPVRTVASMVFYFLAVNVGVWVCPRITLSWLLGWSWSLGAVGLFLLRRKGGGGKSAAPAGSARLRRTGILFLVLLSASALHAGLFSPVFNHDPLTYQLHFAASWLNSGRLMIVPTPFGDPSQAYGPALASVFYVWLMAPLRSDFLAQTGAFPFFLLALLAASGLARELGAKEGREWIAAVFASLSPLFLYESHHALSDFPVTAFFTATVYFVVRAIKASRPRELSLALCSAGLMAGAKYTSLGNLLALFPLFAAGWLWLGWRGVSRLWWGMVLAVAGGGEWYIRNWVRTGNPVYPIRISFFGHELFPGLYDRGIMLRWIFHKNGFVEWLGVVQNNASLPLLVLFLAAGAAVVISAIRCGQWGREAGGGAVSEVPPARTEICGSLRQERFFEAVRILVVFTPLVVDRICWWLFPFQVYRFWMPAVPLMAAVMAVIYSRNLALFLVALVAAGGGFFLQPAPGYLGALVWAWPRTGLPAALALSFLLALGYEMVERKIPRAGMTPRWIFSLLIFGAFTAMMVSAFPGYPGRRAESLRRDWEFGKGWLSLPCPEDGITVAYTGANVPYPLHGPSLQNRVLYISPVGEVMPQDHLAVKKLSTDQKKFLTPEPVVSGIFLCPQKWAEALVSAGVKCLFVMRLPRNPLVNSAHDPQGWPVEDSWARTSPGLFPPVYEDEFVRIYRLQAEHAGEAAALSPACQARPVDALTACYYSLELCQKFFPRALPAMQQMKL